MGAIKSQITSVSIVCGTICSGADQRKHQSSASLAFQCEGKSPVWFPRTKGQQRGTYFNLMTSSCGDNALASGGFPSQRASNMESVSMPWCLIDLISFITHYHLPLFQGLYSLNGRTSYRKISWSPEATKFRFRLFQSHWNLTGTSCQISERYDHYSIQSRGFETSRDLAVRRPPA